MSLEKRRVTGGGRKNEGTREITFSPTLTRGSYESSGGRNPDYCSPNYNITRTDRSACITGDRCEIIAQLVLFNLHVIFIYLRYTGYNGTIKNTFSWLKTIILNKII